MSVVTKPPFLETVVQYASRLICLGSLVWLSLIVANVSDSMIHRINDDKSIASSAVGAAKDVPNLLMGVAEGSWSFAGSELTVQHLVIDKFDMDSRLSRLLDVKAVTANYDATRLIELAKTGGAQQTDHQSGSLWFFENEDLVLRLVTTKINSNSNKPRLVAAAFANRQQDAWHVTLLRPASFDDGQLLTFSDDAETMCSRRSETGNLQMQLVLTSDSSDQLLERWRSEGWQTNRTAWGPADSFSYLCSRNDELVYAWSERNSGSRTIMLTSPSAGHDQKRSRAQVDVSPPHDFPAGRLVASTLGIYNKENTQ